MNDTDIQNEVIKEYKSELRAIKEKYTNQELYEKYMQRIAFNLWRYIQDWPTGNDGMEQAIKEFVNNFPGLEVVKFYGKDSYFDTDSHEFKDIKTETFYIYVNTKEVPEKEKAFKVRNDWAKVEYILVDVKDTDLYLSHDGNISFNDLAQKINNITIESI